MDECQDCRREGCGQWEGALGTLAVMLAGSAAVVLLGVLIAIERAAQ